VFPRWRQSLSVSQGASLERLSACTRISHASLRRSSDEWASFVALGSYVIPRRQWYLHVPRYILAMSIFHQFTIAEPRKSESPTRTSKSNLALPYVRTHHIVIPHVSILVTRPQCRAPKPADSNTQSATATPYQRQQRLISDFHPAVTMEAVMRASEL